MDARFAMTRDVICIGPDDELSAAFAVMTKLRIRHLPVLAGARLIGVLSDRDVLVHAKPGRDGLDVPRLRVSEAMTGDPITARPKSRVSEVAELMIENKIDCVPITDANEILVGLVTSSDLLELLITKDEATRTVLPFDFQLRRELLASAPA